MVQAGSPMHMCSDTSVCPCPITHSGSQAFTHILGRLAASTSPATTSELGGQLETTGQGYP